ncbi:AMP-binding protein [Halalkalicoccus sp. NIPERK01]|uniref:AMP-binding protein n=1 Tax=Halalkalicoccus sp. NIPERK01 TaxID=3053469 RepID=UPI00256ED7DE|nr:AMP-binding protein [Halalkalicoccus sp. NIPERK01]MDL5363809.1 AMP-binding protein [Halalkalicoccus sp. NIPERK01]
MNNEIPSLTEFYHKLLYRYDDRIAVSFRSETLSYATIEERTGRIANAFQSMGMNPGDCVAIMMKNRPEYLITEIAAIRAGATIIPLNSELDSDSIQSILDDAGARTLVLGPTFFSIGRALQQDASFDLDHIIGVEDGSEFPIGFHSFDELLSKADRDVPTVNPSSEDVAAIYYTGGTTGEPKGAMHTHRGLLLNTYSHIAELEIGKRERALLTTPLGHSAGYIARAILAQGGTIVLEQEYNPSQFLETVKDDQITWSFLVPTMISQLLDDPDLDDAETSSLETLVYGASSIPSVVLMEGIDRLGPVFIQLYGLTEVPNLVSVLSKADHDPEREDALLSAGYPVQLADVSIADPENRWEGDVGEIVVSSPYAMKGYWSREPLVGERNRIYTGDLGRIGDDGRLYVFDRIQDVIISNGQPVFPSEVENVVQRYPEIHQVAIIGIPKHRETFDVLSGNQLDIEQVIKAIVVMENDISLESIQEFCREMGLKEHQIPQSMDTVGKLPETPYGKIDKKSLRKPYW